MKLLPLLKIWRRNRAMLALYQAILGLLCGTVGYFVLFVLVYPLYCLINMGYENLELSKLLSDSISFNRIAAIIFNGWLIVAVSFVAACGIAVFYLLFFRRYCSQHEGINCAPEGFAQRMPKLLRLITFQAMGFDSAWYHLGLLFRLLHSNLEACVPVLLPIIGHGRRISISELGIEELDVFERLLMPLIRMECVQLLEVYDPPEVVITTPFRKFLNERRGAPESREE